MKHPRRLVPLLSLLALAAAASCARAQSSARDAFLKNQAYSEMQRVLGQVDVLESNYQDLSSRVRNIERGDSSRSLKAEVESLRVQIADLKREMSSMRSKIVDELAAKLSKMQKTHAPPPPAPKKVVIGPHKEYIVQSGDTLSFISQAFGTTVRKLKEMNSLKSDSLRVGQKLMIPVD